MADLKLKKTNYTPGPWKVNKDGHVCDSANDLYLVAQPAGGCCDGEIYADVKAANTRLISAAPEMWEALQIIANGGQISIGTWWNIKDKVEGK